MRHFGYFTFLSILLIYLGATGAAYGLKLIEQYGVPGILGGLYGWAALTSAKVFHPTCHASRNTLRDSPVTMFFTFSLYASIWGASR